MKGIVFNLLQESVSRQYGDGTWDTLLDAAELEGAYSAIGTYPDEQAFTLVGVASKTLGVSPHDVLRWFGTSAIPLLAESYPQFFAAHTNTRSFLLTLNDIIHPEVRKLYPGADVPTFEFDDSRPESLGIGYQSARKMCAFAEGLILGAAAHYGETVRIAQPECMVRGDDRCLLVCTFNEN
jgi:Haem-NO-binding